MRDIGIALLASTATPAFAQDHSDHAMPSASASASPSDVAECARAAARHRAMGHPVPDGACTPETAPAAPTPPDPDAAHAAHAAHAGMDHGAMDHGHHEHRATPAAPVPAAPPPAAAGSGPARAADAIWGAEAMRPSREALRKEHGGMAVAWFQADRVEYRAREGGDGYLWDLQGYYGGSLDKIWIKSEGEATIGEPAESAELQGLWSHAIGPWWDLQLGLRQDLAGPRRTHMVIGLQGLAPYFFEMDAAAFLSTEGELTARIEAEVDQRITQRLLLQPRAEVTLSAQDLPRLGVGAGLDKVELGVRLRYELAREFAPYIGVEQEWKLGRSADYARLAGEAASVTNYVFGVRLWF